jgi:hypothetical protein
MTLPLIYNNNKTQDTIQHKKADKILKQIAVEHQTSQSEKITNFKLICSMLLRTKPYYLQIQGKLLWKAQVYSGPIDGSD